jgi:hypothetical protein
MLLRLSSCMENIWFRLAGWPVVGLLTVLVWHLLPSGLYHNGSLLFGVFWSDMQNGALDPVLITFIGSFLFLEAFFTDHHYFSGGVFPTPDWARPVGAYSCFPCLAILLICFGDLHGWVVPDLSIGLPAVVETIFALISYFLDREAKPI